jgi:uncharacterized protein
MLVQIEPVNAIYEPVPPPEFHIVTGTRRMVFVVNGSALYSTDAGTDNDPDEAASFEELRQFGTRPATIGIPEQPAALSLNIAQACNLSCRYCYADEGRFGGDAKLMPLAMAIDAIQRHFDSADGPVTVGFIGGEPLVNRDVLHKATRFAAGESKRSGIPVTFGITTNGTLLRGEDIELLRSYPFAVNVSMDGPGAAHDFLRPDRSGAGSFERAIAGVSPLLSRPGHARVSARVTLTRRNLDVCAAIATLSNAGFREIGVSPMRTGPDPGLRIQGSDWETLLLSMKEAALADWKRATETGESLRFSNFSTALRQLYAGACNPLPCGAAANYVSLGADGHYYTCHRTVGDASFEVGDTVDGPSFARRHEFVQARAVDRQEPCRTCWARYLCGGGCHAEVMSVGRAGCDFIRGWLEFCISVYPDVLSERPDLLRPAKAYQKFSRFGGTA